MVNKLKRSVCSGFRGLLRHLNAELTEQHGERFFRLGISFDTLDSYTGDSIRFSLTRAYAKELPYAWCVADLCEYAVQHELQEALPMLFEDPDHRPGELDKDEVAWEHAEKSRARYHRDVESGRWLDGKMKEIKPAW